MPPIFSHARAAAWAVWCCFIPVLDAAVEGDNFNNGSVQSGYWSILSNATVRGQAEPGFNGSNALWFGGSGGRYATTKDFNTSYGASISFKFRAGDYSSAIWEGSDWREALVLEVSTNGGGSWSSLRYFRLWNRSLHAVWRQYTVDLPAVSQSTATRFRFRQTAHSNAGWDHWAIDDVEVNTVDPVGTSWSQSLGENFSIRNLRCDSSGTVQMLIEGTGAFSLGNFSGNSGTYLASAGPNGVWTKLTQLSTARSNQGFTVYGMDTDSSGNVYLSGGYRGHTPMGMPAPAGANGFVVKLSSGHAIQWAKPAWGAPLFTGLAVDGAGNVVVSGVYSGWIRFGPNGYIGEPQLDGDTGSKMIAKYSAGGVYQWSKRVGDDQTSEPQYLAGVRCDSAGNIYAWGRFYGDLSISPLADLVKPAGYSGNQFGFLLKYNASGTAQWSTTMGEVSEMTDVAVDGSSIYCIGTYGYGGNPFKPLGVVVPEVGDSNISSDDWCLLKVDGGSGSVSWVRTAGIIAGETGSVTSTFDQAVRVDPSGNVYTLLNTQSKDILLNGAVTVESYPGFKMVLCRWTSGGDLTWHKRAAFGSAKIDLDPIGQMYVGGHSLELGVFESNAALNRPFLHKFNNIFEATSPVAVTIERETIPANWLEGRDLGLLRTVDADGAGTYTLELVGGDGDTHNVFFEIGSDNHLRLASGARLAEGDEITCRIRVTDEEGVEAESVIEFDTIAPDTGLWVRSFSYDSGNIRASAAGPDGSYYVGGEFIGTLTAGDKTVTSWGISSDWFLVKFDAAGEVLWVVHGGGQDRDYLRAIDVGSDGRIHVGLQLKDVAGNIGIFRNGSAMVGLSGFHVAGANGGALEMAVASFNPDGQFRWFNLMDGTKADAGYSMGLGYDVSSGRVLMTSSFEYDMYTSGYCSRSPFYTGQVSGPTTGPVLTSDGSTQYSSAKDILVVSFDSTGDLEWAKRAGGDSNDVGEAAAFDSQGNAIVFGWFTGLAGFAGTNQSSGGTGTSNENPDVFLWKLNPSGVPVWIRTGGSPDEIDSAHKVGVDGQDNIYIVGQIRYDYYDNSPASFGSVSLAPTSQYDGMVVKYNAAGTALRGHVFGDNASLYPINNEVRGLKVWANGELSIDLSASQIDGVNLLDGSSQPIVGGQHHFAADGTRLWSGSGNFSEFTGFAPDLAPLITREASANEEVNGVILPAGPFAARVIGPTPVRLAPSAISLTAPPSALKFASSLELSASSQSVALALSVDENRPAGTVVANISATDSDSADFTFQLIGGEGSDGNPAFVIAGGQLLTSGPLNYEEIQQYDIRLRVIDESGLTHEQSFSVNVNDLPDTVTPTFTFTNTQHVADGQPHGVSVSVTPYGVPYTLTYGGSSVEPSAVGPHNVVASPSHPDYAGDGTTVMWIRDAYLQWIAAEIDGSVANDPDRQADGWGKLADPDGDRVSNYLEFFYGTFAGVKDAANAGMVSSWSGSSASFEYFHNTDAPDGIARWSPNLLDWYGSGDGPSGDQRTITKQSLGMESGRERVRLSLPRGNGGFGFLRIELP